MAQTLQGMSNKGNTRTIYTTSAAKRDGKDSQVWVSRALQDRGEYWTSSVSQEVALKAAGSSSWHWDRDIAAPHTLWHATGIALPPADVHRRTGRGPEGKAGSVLALCTHTSYPIKHLLLQLISTRNSWAATQCKGINPCPALPGTSHCPVPPTPARAVMLYTSYIRQNWECCHVSYKQKNKSDQRFLHCKRFYIYTESTSLVLALKLQVKSQTGSVFSLSLPTAGLRRF